MFGKPKARVPYLECITISADSLLPPPVRRGRVGWGLASQLLLTSHILWKMPVSEVTRSVRNLRPNPHPTLPRSRVPADISAGALPGGGNECGRENCHAHPAFFAPSFVALSLRCRLRAPNLSTTRRPAGALARGSFFRPDPPRFEQPGSYGPTENPLSKSTVARLGSFCNSRARRIRSAAWARNCSVFSANVFNLAASSCAATSHSGRSTLRSRNRSKESTASPGFPAMAHATPA